VSLGRKVIHHAIYDGISIGALLEELERAYQAHFFHEHSSILRQLGQSPSHQKRLPDISCSGRLSLNAIFHAMNTLLDICWYVF